jgi:hypothetical protein
MAVHLGGRHFFYNYHNELAIILLRTLMFVFCFDLLAALVMSTPQLIQ